MSDLRTARYATLGTVATVVTWAAIVPFVNILIPLYFQVWFELSTVSFFRVPLSAQHIADQMWKLATARAVSTLGTFAIATAALVLRNAGRNRINLWVALGVSAAFSIVWFVINRG